MFPLPLLVSNVVNQHLFILSSLIKSLKPQDNFLTLNCTFSSFPCPVAYTFQEYRTFPRTIPSQAIHPGQPPPILSRTFHPGQLPRPYTCMYVHVHIQKSIYACIYVCALMYVYTYIQNYTHIHAYIPTHTL